MEQAVAAGRSAKTERVVRADGQVVCEQCVVADSPLARMRGLLGRNALSRDEGVLLRPAGSIHTAFMRFPIDAVFLDRELRVVHVAQDVRPWRAAAARGARAVLELRAGEAARRGVEPGDLLRLGG
jgi:uncharacterized membrane protein (UPF0127 family)